MNYPVEIDVDQVLPILDIGLLHQCPQPHTGVIAQQVHGAKVRHDGITQRCDRRQVGHVHMYRQRLRAPCGEFTGHCLCTVKVDIGDNHFHSGICRCPGNTLANPRTGTRDNRHFAC